MRRRACCRFAAHHAGRTAINRLIHILTIALAIAAEALQLYVKHIHQSRNPALYQNILQANEQLAAPELVSLPNAIDIAELEAVRRNRADP